MSINRIINLIVNNDLVEAQNAIHDVVNTIIEEKLHEKKKSIAASISEGSGSFDYDRKNFKDDHDKANAGEEDYGNLRNKEIKSTVTGLTPTGKRALRGTENINDYKDRKNEYFDRAARKSLDIHGSDTKAAAQHMHKLVSGVENKDEPWMHRVGGNWDDLHPSVRDDFHNHIKREARIRTDMQDPVKREKLRARGADAQEKKAELKNTIKLQQKALADFKAKKAGKAPVEKNSRPMSKRIGDEIPHLEESKKPDWEAIKARVSKENEGIKKHRKMKKKMNSKYKKKHGKTFSQDVDELAAKSPARKKSKK